MVIVIVGILAAVTIPRFSAFHLLKLNGAMKKVIADIRYVQQLAISRHTNTQIVFGLSPPVYSTWEESPPGTNIWTWIIDPFTRGNLQVNFNTDPQYGGISITAANFCGTVCGPTLRFNWQGIPQAANGTNLTSEGTVSFSYQGNAYTIFVTPNTGRVRM